MPITIHKNPRTTPTSPRDLVEQALQHALRFAKTPDAYDDLNITCWAIGRRANLTRAQHSMLASTLEDYGMTTGAVRAGAAMPEVDVFGDVDEIMNATEVDSDDDTDYGLSTDYADGLTAALLADHIYGFRPMDEADAEAAVHILNAAALEEDDGAEDTADNVGLEG